ncbi:hypothetical protein E4U17_003180 [Claviceps sp. LM77 group G4]|nr:hypothetical protein E4U17_003180 [Claviceps sp. LM77 group G4]KAG6070699.1 hypothetical protein E4U16_006673 [Claviceps sp. LM84 group G4]KAG6073023.1 hypothetical protein E4U33_003059 [Claviceps sp. LM78 group G4]
MPRSTADTTVASTVTVEAVSQNTCDTHHAVTTSGLTQPGTRVSEIDPEKKVNIADEITYETKPRSKLPDSDAEGKKSTLRPDESQENDAEAEAIARLLFPDLPSHGPPSLLSAVKALFFRITAFFLSLSFLGFLLIASFVTKIPRPLAKKLLYSLTLKDTKTLRPHYEEERRRAEARRQKQKEWEHRNSAARIGGDLEGAAEDFIPTAGGKDHIVCDVAHYARRVGLDIDFFLVRTEDGFLIELWHVYDPRDYIFHDAEEEEASDKTRRAKRPRKILRPNKQKPKFPVLLIHGLLQSSGAYCSNDDDSLAFWLCKSGFDVWLGNNRCGLSPRHASLKYSDPRMWSWTIQHMGLYDLPALTDQVLTETGSHKLGLICHSQGTAQTLIALSKNQRPELGEKLTVFCALAPAAYAGPLVNRYYFRLMNKLSPFAYYLVFGMHAFIPLMMQMHSSLNPRLYGWLSYTVFSFLFDWSDLRWDRGLRNRLFQFAPVYVSSETMRWWLGKGGFASHGCILLTKEMAQYEEEADGIGTDTNIEISTDTAPKCANRYESSERRNLVLAGSPWYNDQVPPFAMWICGKDQLVDGRRLLRRFEKGREPHVKLIYSKVVEEYEHLDVIWAVDAVEQVFQDMRDVLWKTCYDQKKFRTPASCDGGFV